VDIEAILREWQTGIKAAIEAQKQYPAIAERLGHTGSVKFRFSLDAGGGLLSVSVKSSSGWEELDEAAMDAVRAAAPFASIPTELGRDELALSMTLRFKLD
jgi:protein TonB